MAGKGDQNKETLDEFKDKLAVEKIEPLEKRVEALEQFKTKFTENICCAVKESTTIQSEIKILVWKTIKDKILWFLIGAVATLFFAFLQGYFSQLGRAVATTPTPPAIEQTGKTPTN